MAQGGQVCFRAKGDDCCPHHQGQKIMLQCMSCKGTLVCGMCITTLHNQHKFEQLNFGLTEKVEQIKQHVKKSETDTLPKLAIQISSGSKLYQDTENSYAAEIQEAKHQGMQLKEKIDHITAESISVLEICKREDLGLIEKHMERIKKSKQELETETKESKDTIASNNKVLVLDTANAILKQKKTPTMPNISAAHFIPCRDPGIFLEKAFGNINREENNTEVVFWKTPQLLTEYKTKRIASFRLQSNGLFWIHGRDHNKLELMDQTGQPKETRTLDVPIRKMFVHPETLDLYICAAGDKSVRKVSKQDNTKTIVLFHIQAEPIAMVCTSDHLIIGMTSGLVVKYTFNGKIVCPYKFTARYIAICNSTMNLAMVNGGKEVVVLNCRLQEIYRYKAKDDGKGRAFESYSVSFDSYGHLFVVYRPNKEIHVLNAATGQLKEIINTAEFPQILSFVIMNGGIFWMGCFCDLNSSPTVMCIRYADVDKTTQV